MLRLFLIMAIGTSLEFLNIIFELQNTKIVKMLRLRLHNSRHVFANSIMLIASINI